MIADFIIKRKTSVIIVFAVAAVICAFLMADVSVNYRLSDYLPEDSASTAALKVMNDEFPSGAPNLRVYIPDISVSEALEAKEELAASYGVIDVMWLDDVCNLKKPLEIYDKSVTENYFKDGGALFYLTVDENKTASEVVSALRDKFDRRIALSGDIADDAASQIAIYTEITRIVIIITPIILLILIFATSSWLEPLLFAIVILISIIINLGTNVIFGKISFLTQSVAPVLQLAVSMDYIIFLLASFERERKAGKESDPAGAMKKAIRSTFSTVLSSGVTTLIGFIVLVLMRFKIGPDLGLVLAKGILVSIVSSLVLLPALVLTLYKPIEKARHRSFMPDFTKFAKRAVKIKYVSLFVALICVIPCFLAQRQNSFTYGATGVSQGSQLGEDAELIESKFGKSAQMVLLVPRGSTGTEALLSKALSSAEKITSVTSYVNTVGALVPNEIIPKDKTNSLLSEHYSRFIIIANVPDEGAESFSVVENVRSIAQLFYPDRYYLCGTNVNTYDMKETVISDNMIVSVAVIAAIGIVLLINFRNFLLPLLLLFCIETAIWINLSVPFFTGDTIHYISFLIVNTVQLGATIDYAILFTEHYNKFRETMNKKDSAIQAVRVAAPSIIVSAVILSSAGFALGMVSSNFIVGQFGSILARGAMLSALSVLLVFPALLMIFDTLILKTGFCHKAASKNADDNIISDFNKGDNNHE
ncbi:MAG: MMPL family transporter [Oscillospiraceae bacterium]|nr:MMPL family transporter [Oscillospiraceae bacterium]